METIGYYEAEAWAIGYPEPDDLKQIVWQFSRSNYGLLRVITEPINAINNYQVMRRYIYAHEYPVRIFRRKNEIFLLKW